MADDNENQNQEVHTHARYSLDTDYKSGIYNFNDNPEYMRSLLTFLSSFAVELLSLMEAKGLKSQELYKRANVNRDVYCKIIKDSSYTVGRDTAISFAIALGLNLEETQRLLSRAGYVLMDNNERDSVILSCMYRGETQVVNVNLTLAKYKQKPLGRIRE